ncbi:MAG: endonuclease/exonuclease/phosphatase family protein [Planctomycetota bacterium]
MVETQSPVDQKGQSARGLFDWERNKRALYKRSWILLWAACICTATGFLGRWWLGFELTSHFRMQYFLLLLVAVPFLAWRRRWTALGTATAALLVNGAVILPFYFHPVNTVADTRGETLRILSANVHTSNTRYDRLLDLIKKEDPDIIVLNEINAEWNEALASLEETYRYNKRVPRPDNFGIAIYSRFLFRKAEIVEFGEGYVPPTIIAEVQKGEAVFNVVATHPLPPIGPWYYARRNSQLASLAEYISLIDRPVVMAGDLNMSVWSHYYRKFLAGSGLKDARQGFGVYPSWPTVLPFLYIPIDHCFCSREVTVVKYRTGARIGSDHLPVIVDLVIPLGKQPAG